MGLLGLLHTWFGLEFHQLSPAFVWLFPVAALPAGLCCALPFRSSETTKMLFLEDVPTFIATGNSRWTGWFGDDETGYPYDVSCFCTVDTC